MNTLAPGDEREPRRSVPLSSVAVFVLLNGIAALPVIVLDRALGDFVQRHDLARLAIWLAIFVPLSMLSCRVFLTVFPLPLGEIEAKSRGEFAYCVYMLFMIVVVPLLYLSFLPFPLRRYAYILLGARIGKNTHCPGRILDPPLVQIGDDVVIGYESLFSGHAFERDSYVLSPIVIGRNVTIGGRAIILPGVIIGDGATVAVGAVVRKGTRIGPGELWGGVPARLIKAANDVGIRSLATEPRPSPRPGSDTPQAM